jgi:hypothetical protein
MRDQRQVRVRANDPWTRWPQDIRRIVANASTPLERSTWSCFRPARTRDVEGITYRLRVWRQSAAADDAARWSALLALRGLTPRDCLNAVAPVRFDPRRHHPAWAADIRRCLTPTEPALEPRAAEALVAHANEAERALVTCCLPLLAVPVRLLARRADGITLSADAQCDLLLQLVRRWGRLLTPLLRAPITPADILLGRRGVVGETVRETYLRAGDAPSLTQWRTLCLTYPVAARLVAVTARYWWESTQEWLRHLAAHYPSVTVARVTGDAGDVHERGRSVAILQLADGTRLVYKPRDLQVASALDSLDDVVQAHGGPASVLRRTSLRMPTYTWDAFVSAHACETAEDVSAYFTRLGGLARLLEFTGATDCTTDNVLAAGAWPALIDQETLLTPMNPAPAATLADQQIQRRALHGPWTSGAITARIDGAVAWPSADLGALARPAQRDAPFPVLPGAQPGDECQQFSGNSATPLLDGQPVDPRRYWPQVRAGYRAVHNALARAAVNGALTTWQRTLRGARVRVILRDTQVYDRLLRASVQPERLTDGALRELYLESVWRAAHRDPRIPAAEQAALRDGEIPVFFAEVDRRVLDVGRGQHVAGYFTRSAVACVRHRIQALVTGADASRHADARLSTALFLLDPGHAQPVPPTRVQRRGAGWHPVRDAEALLIPWRERAVVGSDGSLNWMGVHYRPEHDRWRVCALPPTMYTGLGALAVVCATLASTGVCDGAWLSMARRLAWQLDAALTRDEWRLRPAAPWFWSWGATFGATWHCAQLLGDARLRDSLLARAAVAATAPPVGWSRDVVHTQAWTGVPLPAPPPADVSASVPCAEPDARPWRNAVASERGVSRDLTDWVQQLSSVDRTLTVCGDTPALREQVMQLHARLDVTGTALPGLSLPDAVHACGVDGRAGLAYQLLRSTEPDRYVTLCPPFPPQPAARPMAGIHA